MRATLTEFSGRELASVGLRQRLRATVQWDHAAVVYGFFPLSTEPNWLGSAPIVGKQIAFPRTEGQRMTFLVGEKMISRAYGLIEPEGGPPAPPPDLILVPGLAFTRDGRRLGRGGGFYDRWLATQSGIPTLGICFSCQLVDALPIEMHDVRLDAILTEDGLMGVDQ